MFSVFVLYNIILKWFWNQLFYQQNIFYIVLKLLYSLTTNAIFYLFSQQIVIIKQPLLENSLEVGFVFSRGAAKS